MHIDPWILTFSAATVIATIWMGFWSARKSKTASDFFVASCEYLALEELEAEEVSREEAKEAKKQL